MFPPARSTLLGSKYIYSRLFQPRPRILAPFCNQCSNGDRRPPMGAVQIIAMANPRGAFPIGTWGLTAQRSRAPLHAVSIPETRYIILCRRVPHATVVSVIG